MSSPESFRDRARNPEQQHRELDDLSKGIRRHWRWLTVGAIFGLLLGLFVGWVLWPVQYTTALPSELSLEAKSQYVAAVADAYAAARSEDAAQLARQRLAWFGDETAAELAAAEQYFEQSSLPDKSIRVTNIIDLAFALNLTTELAGRDAGEPEPTEDVAPASPSSAEDQVVPTPEGAPEWLTLMLWMFAAFVLIAGGIWVLRAVMRTSTQGDIGDVDEIDEFSESDFQQPTVTTVQDGGAEGFDAFDADLEPDADERDAEDQGQPLSDQWSGDTPVDERPRTVSVISGSTGAVLGGALLDDPDGYGFQPEPEQVGSTGKNSTAIFAEVEEADLAVSDAGLESDAEPGLDSTEAEDEAETPLIADAASRQTVSTGPEVARFAAHFQPNLDEYEEAFTIEDQSGYMGDCGMGVNMKQGLLRNNPEHVTVLDVWLVDLAQDAEMTFHSVSLVSEHGVASGLAQKLAQDNSGNQLLPAPEAGSKFQIAGHGLLIDCKVVAVEYAAAGEAKGVFTECKLDMVVRRR